MGLGRIKRPNKKGLTRQKEEESTRKDRMGREGPKKSADEFRLVSAPSKKKGHQNQIPRSEKKYEIRGRVFRDFPSSHMLRRIYVIFRKMPNKEESTSRP